MHRSYDFLRHHRKQCTRSIADSVPVERERERERERDVRMVGLLMSSVNRCFSVRLTEKLLQKTKFIPKLVNKDAFSSTRISKSRWFLTRIILGKDANFGASYFFFCKTVLIRATETNWRAAMHHLPYCCGLLLTILSVDSNVETYSLCQRKNDHCGRSGSRS